MARVCAVASSKGGVGKTTTTANLSATLAAAGYDVAVVDGDIGMANLGDQLGVQASGETLHDVLASGASVEDACYEGPHGMTVVPGGTDLEAFSEADITRLGRVVGSFADRDFVFVDTGAGLSHETALPVGLADEVVLVSTADRDSLKDTEKTRKLAEKLGAEVTGAVLTRVSPGDEPGDASPLAAPVLGTVPEDTALHEANDRAVPVTELDTESAAAAAYRSVADGVASGAIEQPGEAAETEEEPAYAADASRAGGNAEPSGAVPEEPMAGAEEAAQQVEQEASQQETAETRTQNRRAGSRGTKQGQPETEGQTAGSWEQSEAWSEQSAESLKEGDDIPTAEAGVEVEAGESGEGVAFEDGPRTAPIEEEADAEAESASESKGFISRLFS